MTTYAIQGSPIQQALQLKTCAMVQTADGREYCVPTTDPRNADYQTLQAWAADSVDGGTITTFTAVKLVGAEPIDGLTVTTGDGRTLDAPGDLTDVTFQWALAWLNENPASI